MAEIDVTFLYETQLNKKGAVDSPFTTSGWSKSTWSTNDLKTELVGSMPAGPKSEWIGDWVLAIHYDEPNRSRAITDTDFEHEGWEYETKHKKWIHKPFHGAVRRRRRWVRMTKTDVKVERPHGTGRYSFALIFAYENEREVSEGARDFSVTALTPLDHPPFCDRSGQMSLDRWRSAGNVGSRYCAWRSLWKPASGWEFAHNFRSKHHLWSSRRMMTHHVRRRLWHQVIQLEYTLTTTPGNSPDPMLEDGPDSVNLETPKPNSLQPPDTPKNIEKTDGKLGENTDDTQQTVVEKGRPLDGSFVDIDSFNSPAAKGDINPHTGIHDGMVLQSDIPDQLEWVLADEVLDVDLETLYHTLNDDDTPFAPVLLKANGFSNYKNTPWSVDQETGKLGRHLEYVLPKSALIKATPATEIETMMCMDLSKVVCSKSIQSAPTLPMGTNFTTHRMQTLEKIDDKTTRFRVSVEVVFSKSLMMRKILLSTVKKEATNLVAKITQVLKDYLKTLADAKVNSAAAQTQVISEEVVEEVEEEDTTEVDIFLSNPMTLNELEALRADIDGINVRQDLERVLTVAMFETNDLIARIHSLVTDSPAWQEWCTDATEKETYIRNWQKAAILSIVVVEEASSRIQYLEYKTEEDKVAQLQVRDSTVAFISSPTISEFIRQMSLEYSLPEFSAVLSAIGETNLALKSMWCAAIDNALRSKNAHIVCDHLERFKEDLRIKDFGAEFYETSIQRLSSDLRELRLTDLCKTMCDNDREGAHAAMRHLIREGHVSEPGGSMALLISPDFTALFQEASMKLAGKFLEDAESGAFRARERQSPERSPVLDRKSTPRHGKQQKSRLTVD
eukprot:m.167166 g.167166  ORF g.167166 m.167166 type:complete len:844 (-) comp31455_c0_seq3:98-2629(-)